MDEPLRDKPKAQPASFDLLPTHVLLEILKYNSAKDWRMLRQTSRRFRKLLPLALLEQRFNEEFHQLEKNAPNQKIGVADIVRALLKSNRLEIRTETIKEKELTYFLLDGQDIDTYIEIDDRAAVWVMLYANLNIINSPSSNLGIYLDSLKKAIEIGRIDIVDIFLNMIKFDVLDLDELLYKTFGQTNLLSKTKLDILSLLLKAGAQANSLYNAYYDRANVFNPTEDICDRADFFKPTKEILELLVLYGLRIDRYIGSISDFYNIDLLGSKIYRKNILCTSFPKEFEKLEASREQQVIKEAKKSEIDIENVANLLLAANRLKINIIRDETAEGEVERAEVLLDGLNIEHYIQHHNVGAVYVMLFEYAQLFSGQSTSRSLPVGNEPESSLPRPYYAAWLTAAVKKCSSVMVAIFCEMMSPTREELNQQLRDALSFPMPRLNPGWRELNEQLSALSSLYRIVDLLLANGASANCLLDIFKYILCFNKKMLILLFCHGLNCDSSEAQQIFSFYNLDLVKLRDCEKKFREACNIFADYDGIQLTKEPPRFLTADEAEALKQKAHALLLEAYNISPEILDILCHLKRGLSDILSFHDALEVIKKSNVDKPFEYDEKSPRAQR